MPSLSTNHFNQPQGCFHQSMYASISKTKTSNAEKLRSELDRKLDFLLCWKLLHTWKKNIGRFLAFLDDGEANSPRWKNKKQLISVEKTQMMKAESKSGKKNTIVNCYQDPYFYLNKQSRSIALILWRNHLSFANWKTFDVINDLRV